jgi:uncharacterized protein
MRSLTRSEKALLRVVLDTNVYISAVIFDGNPAEILKLIQANKFQLFISSETEQEVINKLSSKFESATQIIADFKSFLNSRANYLVPAKKVRICRDPEDNVFLEVALESKADYLITGDKDLLILKTFKSTKIVSPKEFLKVI